MVAWIVAAALLLQSAPPATPPNAEAASITIDFFARGADGQLVADLSAADVSLKIGGKVRPLQSLELVSTAAGGRNIVLIVDEATLFGLEQVVKDALGKLVASLHPTDRIAYVSTRRGRLVPLTTNHDTVATAAQGMATGPGILYTCLSDMMRSLEILSRTIPHGRATSIVVLSRGSTYDPSLGTDSGAVGCTPRSTALRHLADVVSAAQINIHLLTVDHTNRSWGLDTLARNIGASTGLVTWADTGAVDRAVASAARFYRATIAADRKANDRPQRVELRVDRPKVKVVTSPTVRIDGGSRAPSD